jgi:hypothetical protein
LFLFYLFYYLNLFLGLMFIIIIIEFTWHELFDLFTLDILPKIWLFYNDLLEFINGRIKNLIGYIIKKVEDK